MAMAMAMAMAFLRTTSALTPFTWRFCTHFPAPNPALSRISPFVPPVSERIHPVFGRISCASCSSSPPRVRSFSTSPNYNDYSAEIDYINAKFAEAREEIEMARESKETVYFNEEAETARAAAKLVLDKYDALLKRLPEAHKGSVQRSMGLKMEQLKAEVEQLND